MLTSGGLGGLASAFGPLSLAERYYDNANDYLNDAIANIKAAKWAEAEALLRLALDTLKVIREEDIQVKHVELLLVIFRKLSQVLVSQNKTLSPPDIFDASFKRMTAKLWPSLSTKKKIDIYVQFSVNVHSVSIEQAIAIINTAIGTLLADKEAADSTINPEFHATYDNLAKLKMGWLIKSEDKSAKAVAIFQGMLCDRHLSKSAKDQIIVDWLKPLEPEQYKLVRGHSLLIIVLNAFDVPINVKQLLNYLIAIAALEKDLLIKKSCLHVAKWLRAEPLDNIDLHQELLDLLTVFKDEAKSTLGTNLLLTFTQILLVAWKYLLQEENSALLSQRSITKAELNEVVSAIVKISIPGVLLPTVAVIREFCLEQIAKLAIAERDRMRLQRDALAVENLFLTQSLQAANVMAASTAASSSPPVIHVSTKPLATVGVAGGKRSRSEALDPGSRAADTDGRPTEDETSATSAGSGKSGETTLPMFAYGAGGSSVIRVKCRMNLATGLLDYSIVSTVPS